jgi:tetratricopeptide (TPR) repeat protein
MSELDDEDTTIQRIETVAPIRRRGRAHLTVLSGGMVGQTFAIDVGEAVIGRATSADIQINEDGISRKHAKVLRDEDGTAKLQDLGSTNGTYLNGRRIEIEVLREGDRIRIGQSATLDFRYEYLDDDGAARLAVDGDSGARVGGGYDNLAATLDTLGKVYSAGKKYDQAIAAYRRTLAIRERKFGNKHPAVAAILDNIGSALQDKGDLREALVCHQRALTIYESLDADKPPPEMAHVLTHVGEVQLRLGRVDDALAALERASSMMQARDATDGELASVRFALARARSQKGETYAAIAMARLARDGFAAGGKATRPDLDRVADWIAAHGG